MNKRRRVPLRLEYPTPRSKDFSDEKRGIIFKETGKRKHLRFRESHARSRWRRPRFEGKMHKIHVSFHAGGGPRRDDGSGHVRWIDRHVKDLNRPYGLAWQGDHVLVADQDGHIHRPADFMR